MDKKQTILTHMSFKGGSSKTCLNLSLALQYCSNYPEKRVLFIDADPQSNATTFIFGEEQIEENLYTIQDGMINNVSIDKLIAKAPLDNFKNLDVIASCIDMITLELNLFPRMGKETILLRYFNEENNKKILSEYDLIIFDLNPAISILNTNVLLCCTDIIPILNYGCYSTVTGYKLLIKTYTDMKKALNITNKDDLRKPVITKFEKQSNKKIERWLELVESKGILGNTFKQTMRKSVHYENAVLFNRAIESYIDEENIRTDIRDEISNLINEYIKENIINI